VSLVTNEPNCRPTVKRSGPSWQQAIKRAVRDRGELLRQLGLPAQSTALAQAAEDQFPLFVPQEWIDRIRPGDPHDPLLRQILPLDAETQPFRGFTADPVDDQTAALAPGLLRKYYGRALIVTTGTCAVHCRYCFRRHFPYEALSPPAVTWDQAIEWIAAEPDIQEVLLSGGDPLMLVDASLANLAQRLARIPHVRRLRVHSRLPIVIPQRVDDRLISWLSGLRLTTIMVVHANHPAEIDVRVAAALERLVKAGVPVLNQAVLLRGVNDRAEVLIELCERLINLGVIPYYLHQLDRVAGAAHFEVPIERGREIIAQLRSRLPGYAVPRYVHERPGAPSKTVLA